MKSLVAVATVAAFSLQAAFADTTPRQTTGFRTAAPTAFSPNELSRFSLDPATAARVEEHRKAGDRILVMTPEELAEAKAGQMDTTWVIIGIVVLVVIVAAAGGGGGGGGY